jgi:hypothetical protein
MPTAGLDSATTPPPVDVVPTRFRDQRTAHKASPRRRPVDNREDCPQIIRERWTGGSPSRTVQP